MASYSFHYIYLPYSISHSLFDQFYLQDILHVLTLCLCCNCSIPLYLALNVLYGAEVSKELTPLWVFGPLIVALHIKMFRVIFALYVFSFKQTVKVVKNLPSCYLVVRSCVAGGNLKEGFRNYVWQPLIDGKNSDFEEVKGKMKILKSWLVERYLDCFELIWPYYCRTIRFLKRANLI